MLLCAGGSILESGQIGTGHLADWAASLNDDGALFLISQSSQAVINNPSQTTEGPETISTCTLSQQARTLIPYLPAQDYLPDAGDMSMTALLPLCHEAG